jgi:hypothetical protein
MFKNRPAKLKKSARKYKSRESVKNKAKKPSEIITKQKKKTKNKIGCADGPRPIFLRPRAERT